MSDLQLPTGLLVKRTKRQKIEMKKSYGNMLNDYFFRKFYQNKKNKTRKNYI